jgi:hypothetical protein
VSNSDRRRRGRKPFERPSRPRIVDIAPGLASTSHKNLLGLQSVNPSVAGEQLIVPLSGMDLTNLNGAGCLGRFRDHLTLHRALLLR